MNPIQVRLYQIMPSLNNWQTRYYYNVVSNASTHKGGNGLNVTISMTDCKNGRRAAFFTFEIGGRWPVILLQKNQGHTKFESNRNWYYRNAGKKKTEALQKQMAASNSPVRRIFNPNELSIDFNRMTYDQCSESKSDVHCNCTTNQNDQSENWWIFIG